MAKSIIDALVVTLGLDNSQFKKNIKDSEKAQKDFATKTESLNRKQSEAERKKEQQKEKFHKLDLERNKQVLEGFRRLRDSTIAFLAIFTAGKGFIDFAEDVITSTSAFERLSDKIGIGIHELGGWDLAMKQVGGTTEQATELLERANEAQSLYKNGISTPLAQGLLTMGGQVNVLPDFTTTKSTLLSMSDIIQRWAKLSPNTAFAMAKKWLGVADQQYFLMKRGSTALDQLLSQDAKVEGLTEGLGKAAKKSEIAWTTLGERLKAIGRIIALNLSGPVIQLVSKFAEFVGNKDNLQAVTKAMKDFGDVVKNMDLTKLSLTPEFKMLLEELKWVHDLFKDIGQGLGLFAGAAVTGTNISSIASGGTGHVPVASYSEVGKSLLLALLSGNLHKFGSGDQASQSTTTQNITINVNGSGSPMATAKAINAAIKSNSAVQ